MATKTLYDNTIIDDYKNLDDYYLIATKGAFNNCKVSIKEFKKQRAYKRFKENVGIKKIFNDNPQYQDTPYIDRGFSRYVRFGTAGTKEEYPEYCESLGIIEETFIFSDYKDGTIANNPLNSGELNGLYKLDTLKKHSHDMQHDHDMSHQHGVLGLGVGSNNNSGTMVYQSTREVILQNISTTGGRSRTGASSTPNTGEAGSDRTQMRHTLVQIYILAKFLE